MDVFVRQNYRAVLIKYKNIARMTEIDIHIVNDDFLKAKEYINCRYIKLANAAAYINSSYKHQLHLTDAKDYIIKLSLKATMSFDQKKKYINDFFEECKVFNSIYETDFKVGE